MGSIIHGQGYKIRQNVINRRALSAKANQDKSPQNVVHPSACPRRAVAPYAMPLMPESLAPESQKMSQFVEGYSKDTEQPVPGRTAAHNSSAADAQAAPGVVARYPPPQGADACDDCLALSWPNLAPAVETPSGVALGLPTNHARRTYTGEIIQLGARRVDGVVCPVSLLDCQLMRAELHDRDKEIFFPNAVENDCFRFQISVGLSFRCERVEHA